MPLQLTLTDYVDDTRWRWVLNDENGAFLGDHDVTLNLRDNEAQGFRDVGAYLAHYRAIRAPRDLLDDLGAWIGENVFGSLRGKLAGRFGGVAQTVEVIIPREAQDLLAYPFELARLESGRGFVEENIRFVYRLEGHSAPQAPPRDRQALRILAAFSLPVGENPLNLRRERYRLQRLIRNVRQMQNGAVELRVVQYGATRKTLRKALEEAPGWDVVHLSGHGKQGALVLEDDRGRPDEISASHLAELLKPTAARLQLLILAACYSGAGTHAFVRRELGLEPTRKENGDAADDVVERAPEAEPTVLPNLALSLSETLGCTSLAMRYPVGDTFATELVVELYDRLLNQRHAVPGALQLAVREVVAKVHDAPALSAVTPILLGSDAHQVRLVVPTQAYTTPTIEPTVLSGYPLSPPERFVGRLQPMMRASRALAPESPKRGVLFYGMPGAGKTSCALELAFRHEKNRFLKGIWYQAPEEGSDVAGALANFLGEVSRRIGVEHLSGNIGLLDTHLGNPDQFRNVNLPRLRTLLEQVSLFLVLDNLESLLTGSGAWRDPLWGDVMEVLLGHDGLSRVVLTSRRQPTALAGDDRIQSESIHALSLAESYLLARELPHLSALFEEGGDGRDLFRRTLRVVQGHPTLLEFSNVLAERRDDLAARVEDAEAETEDRASVLDAFFAPKPSSDGGVRAGTHAGETQQSAQDFVAALKGWTGGVASIASPTARLLFQFLCRLEPEDRVLDVIQFIWEHVLQRLGDEHDAARSALSEPGHGLTRALDTLVDLGLIRDEPFEMDEQIVRSKTAYALHPGVAEAMREETDPEVLQAVDEKMGAFHGANAMHNLKEEMNGRGGAIVDHARRAVPYLMRQEKWEETAGLLEEMIYRDRSPTALAFAIPLLSRIAEAADGTDYELPAAGVLAGALRLAGRHDEAAKQLEKLIEDAAGRGEYRQVSVSASEYADLLRSMGQYDQALDVVDRKSAYTRKSGLGRWSQISDDAQRLQILALQGRHEAVMSDVDALIEEMQALPEDRATDEATEPWRVREGVLDAGRAAALGAKEWAKALAYSQMIQESKKERGASRLEMEKTRFNDYSPLLRLGKVEEAREVLKTCRSVFEEEGTHDALGKVYTALADVEDEGGNARQALTFEETALPYKYRSADPEACAVSHHNLANYLVRSVQSTDRIRAHRLAAALFFVMMRSGELGRTLHALASMEVPDVYPSFETVADTVEEIEGVRFRELYARLCNGQPNGESALETVWSLVDEVRVSPPSSLDDVLEQFEPLLQFAARALTDESAREQVVPLLEEAQERGWMLVEPVRRVWNGERDADRLTDGLDDQDTALVRRLLAIVEVLETG